jgi:succinyl-CoA synthetase alpha subunit
MIIDGISPRLPAIAINSVKIDSLAGNPVIIIHIGQSLAKPHMVVFKNSPRFKVLQKHIDIDYQLDLAVVITPNTIVPMVIEECGKKGTKTIVIISAGFKETGERGKMLEDKIKGIAKYYDMRVMGPNCIGISHRL